MAPDAFDAASSEGWAERLASLRNRLIRFATDHADLLAHAQPQLFAAADLGELRAKSTALDGAHLLHEHRRKKLRLRLGELTDPAWAAALPGDRLTPVVDDAIMAASQSTELTRDFGGIRGLRLPEDWTPWSADAVERVDEATSTSTSVSVLNMSIGATAVHELLDLPPASSALLMETDAVWRAWCAALSATELTVDAWCLPPDGGEPDWMAAWDRAQQHWHSDLQSSGTLRPQRAASISAATSNVAEAGLTAFALDLQSCRIRPSDAAGALLRGAAHSSLTERVATNQLADFDREQASGLVESYSSLNADGRAEVAQELVNTLIAHRPFDPQNLRGEVAELRRQIDRKRGGLTFRELASRYSHALQSIAPCFLMSPGSVAHYLPGDFTFDVVVFDEASQIRVSQAVGALGRGRSAVIAGDSKQMPPTRIMEVSASGSDPVRPDGSDGESDVQSHDVIVEDLESILEEAVESGLPREWLTWHYRSHDERLIAFSNRAYYEDRLVTLPSPRLTDTSRESASATGLEWRRVDGVFDRGRTRTNDVEAREIVACISRRLADPQTRNDSIGVVTFNIQQRDLILDLLEDSTDLQIKAAMNRATGDAIFVKNLESVQGDERDVIMFSLAFSRHPVTGRLPLQFGPLVLPGGERRLNVAITRARKRVILFSSFDSGDLDVSRSNAQGLVDLKAYLEFAGGGPLPSARAAEGDTQRASASAAGTPERSSLVDALRTELRDRGYVVETGLGLSRFKVDLAVRRPEDAAGWRVAVVVDGPAWAALPTVADRDGAPGLLGSIMNWPAVERVWLPAWLRNRDDVIAHLVETIEATDPFGAVPPEGSPPVAQPEDADDDVSDPDAPADAPSGAEPGPAPGAHGLDAPSFPLAASFTAFFPADSTAVARPATLNNPRLAEPAVQRYAQEILDAEGPTSADRLARLIAARFGLSRLVEQRKNDILDIVTHAFPTTESGGFVWPFEIDPDHWHDVARATTDGSRTFADISLHELANGMVILLRQAFSMRRDELMSETVRAFGYSRVTPAVRSRLDHALRQAVADGRIMVDDQRARLAR